jgi:hypothetical protein
MDMHAVAIVLLIALLVLFLVRHHAESYESRLMRFVSKRPILKRIVSTCYVLIHQMTDVVIHRLRHYLLVFPSRKMSIGIRYFYRTTLRRYGIHRRARQLVRLFAEGSIQFASVVTFNPRGDSPFVKHSWEIGGVQGGKAYRYAMEEDRWDWDKDAAVPHLIVDTLDPFPVEVILRTAELMSRAPQKGIMARYTMSLVEKDGITRAMPTASIYAYNFLLENGIFATGSWPQEHSA